MEKFTFIYCLLDPRTGIPRYVGKANNPLERLKNHCNPARYKPTHVFNWLRELRKNSLKPLLVILEKVPIEIWKQREKHWIRYFRKKNFPLVNYTEGGDGLSFGNQTSFKKGQIPWNAGTACKRDCIVCGTEFKYFPSTNQQSCSSKCAAKIRIGSEKTMFQKGSVPWNKGLKNKKLKPDKNVLQYTKDKLTFIKKWDTAKQAALELGLNEEAIGQCCRNQSKSSGGFWWSYINYIKDETKNK